MIKKCLLNFFKNLKYIFTSLGTMFLGLLFGCFFLLSGFETQVKTASTEIQTITNNANININNLKNIVVDSFAEVSWEDPIEAIKTITSQDFLQTTLKANLEKEIENYAAFAKDIENAIVSAFNGYKVYISMFVLCMALGLLAGFLLTKFLIRQNIAKRAFWKYFLVSAIDSIFSVIIVFVSALLALVWSPGAAIFLVASILLFGIISLFEAYVVHGWKKVGVKKIVNIKNSALLFVSNVLIFLISIALATIIYFLTNILVSLFVSIALFEISFIVISLNAEAYVKGIAYDEQNIIEPNELDINLKDLPESTNSEKTASISEAKSISKKIRKTNKKTQA